MREITVALPGCGSACGGVRRLTTGARHHLAAHQGLQVPIGHLLARGGQRRRPVQVPGRFLTGDQRCPGIPGSGVGAREG